MNFQSKQQVQKDLKVQTKEDIDKVLDETVESTFGAAQQKDQKSSKYAQIELDEFDILNARIDSKDAKMMEYKSKLETDI